MNRSFILNSLRVAAVAFAFLVFVAGPASAQVCSTLVSAPRGMWCDPIPGTCGILGVGTLVQASRICVGQNLVCGCDGTTYYNDCARSNRQVAKLADASCVGFTGRPKR